MNPNDHWSKSFQDWRNRKISISSIQKQLKLFKRIGIDLDLIKTDLASSNQEGFYKVSKSKITRPNVFNDSMYMLKSNAIIKVE